MTSKITRVFVPLLFVLFSCQMAHSASPWNVFLRNPTAESIRDLKEAIGERTDQCSQIPMPSSKEINQLFRLVQDANDSALRAALLVSNCLGIGDLEDLYRASGSFLEARTTTFLQIASEREIPEGNLRYMVTMLPLSLVDNLPGQVLAVNKRIALLEAVDDGRLIKIRNRVVAYLQVAKSELEKISE
jgi:hypothetical protein